VTEEVKPSKPKKQKKLIPIFCYVCQQVTNGEMTDLNTFECTKCKTEYVLTPKNPVTYAQAQLNIALARFYTTISEAISKMQK